MAVCVQGRWPLPLDRVRKDRELVCGGESVGVVRGALEFSGGSALAAPGGVGAVVSPVGHRAAVPVLQRTHCLFFGPRLGRRARRFGSRRASRSAHAPGSIGGVQGAGEKATRWGWGGSAARSCQPGPKEVSCWETAGRRTVLRAFRRLSLETKGVELDVVRAFSSLQRWFENAHLEKLIDSQASSGRCMESIRSISFDLTDWLLWGVFESI